VAHRFVGNVTRGDADAQRGERGRGSRRLVYAPIEGRTAFRAQSAGPEAASESGAAVGMAVVRRVGVAVQSLHHRELRRERGERRKRAGESVSTKDRRKPQAKKDRDEALGHDRGLGAGRAFVGKEKRKR